MTAFSVGEINSSAVFRSASAAALLTLGTFLLLPFLDVLPRSDAETSLLRSIDTVPAPIPHPPQNRERDIRTSPSERKLPRPKLLSPRKALLPPGVVLPEFGVNNVAADFALGFELFPDSLLSRPDNVVFEIADLDKPPEPVVQLRPLYPMQAKQRGIEGGVDLEFIVDVEGNVREVRASASHPGEVFVRTTISAARRWRFRPGMKDGMPVEVRVKQKISFRLEK